MHCGGNHRARDMAGVHSESRSGPRNGPSVEVEKTDHREQDHQDEPDRDQHREDAGKIDQPAGDGNAWASCLHRGGVAALGAPLRYRTRFRPDQPVAAFSTTAGTVRADPSDPAPPKPREEEQQEEREYGARSVRVVRDRTDLVGTVRSAENRNRHGDRDRERPAPVAESKEKHRDGITAIEVGWFLGQGWRSGEMKSSNLGCAP